MRKPKCPKCNTIYRVEYYHGYKEGNFKCQKCKYVWLEERKVFPAPKPEDRICYHCNYIQFVNAEPGYSEYTPGSDFHFLCHMGKWELDAYNDDLYDFYSLLQTAKDCEHFSLNSFFDGGSDVGSL